MSPNLSISLSNDMSGLQLSGWYRCSQALEMCIGVLANGKHRMGAAEQRSNLLLPNPGASPTL